MAQEQTAPVVLATAGKGKLDWRGILQSALITVWASVGITVLKIVADWMAIAHYSFDVPQLIVTGKTALGIFVGTIVAKLLEARKIIITNAPAAMAKEIKAGSAVTISTDGLTEDIKNKKSPTNESI